MRKMMCTDERLDVSLKEIIKQFIDNGYTRISDTTVEFQNVRYTISESEFDRIFRVSSMEGDVFVTMTDKGMSIAQRWISIADPYDLPWETKAEFRIGIPFIIEYELIPNFETDMRG